MPDATEKIRALLRRLADGEDVAKEVWDTYDNEPNIWRK